VESSNGTCSRRAPRCIVNQPSGQDGPETTLTLLVRFWLTLIELGFPSEYRSGQANWSSAMPTWDASELLP
jgi:hypothetical protein